MSTQFTNRQWRLPNNENKDKQSNYSMDFDGSSQYVDLGDDDIFSFGDSTNDSPFSISTWWKMDDANGFRGIQKYTTSNYEYRLNTIGSSGILKCQLYDNNNTIYIGRKSVVGLNSYVGQWIHVAMTYDGSSVSNGIKLYLNGSLLATNDDSNGSYVAMHNTSANLYIGKFDTIYANGQIDGVSIYNYELSSSQVTTLYGSSSTGIGNPMSLSPKPVAYYPLGDQDAFNGASYLTPNVSLKDFVFDFDAASSDAITLGNTIGNGFTQITCSAWVNLSTTELANNSIYRNFLVKFNGTALGPFELRGNYARGDSGNNKLFFRVATDTGSYGFTDTGFAFTEANRWYHIVGTYDGSNVKTFVDGVEKSSISANGTLVSNSDNATIGFDTSTGGFDGKISNAQIFNTALPATGSNSIETLYNNGSPLTSMTGFTSLQGWWKLDASATYDGSNWSIPDDSTNSNDGTSSGMTQANLVQSDLSFTSGYSPYALDFDSASSDNIIVNSNTGLNFGTGDFTYSLWGKINTTTSNPAFYGGGSGSNNPAANSGYLSIGVHTSQPTGYVGATRCWISGEVFNGTTIITDDNWHNIVLTRTSGVVQIYVDGNIEVMRDSSGNVVSNPTSSNSITNTNGISIGSFRTNANYINGTMSNASIWNTALTSAQVSEIYNEGVPSNLNNHSAYSNLVSWWQLGSNSSFNSSLNQWTCIDEKGTNTGESSQTFNEDAIVDGVGSYANGLSSGMGGDEVIGDAPYSSSNALSVNMDVEDRVTDTPS